MDDKFHNFCLIKFLFTHTIRRNIFSFRLDAMAGIKYLQIGLNATIRKNSHEIDSCNTLRNDANAASATSTFNVGGCCSSCEKCLRGKYVTISIIQAVDS